jgi:type II secretory pathway pseudopilin PulG
MSRTVQQRSSGGFTYIGLLLAIAIVGFFIAAVSEVWHMGLKREREAELLFAGDQIRRALTRYATSAPGGERYPRRLEDLLRDPRYPLPRRYLRQVYRDPMSADGTWGLVKSGDFIIGVNSSSEEEPLKTGAFAFADRAFEEKKKYSEWIFMAQEPARGTRARVTGAATAPQQQQPQRRATPLR